RISNLIRHSSFESRHCFGLTHGVTKGRFGGHLGGALGALWSRFFDLTKHATTANTITYQIPPRRKPFLHLSAKRPPGVASGSASTQPHPPQIHKRTQSHSRSFAAQFLHPSKSQIADQPANRSRSPKV